MPQTCNRSQICVHQRQHLRVLSLAGLQFIIESKRVIAFNEITAHIIGLIALSRFLDQLQMCLSVHVSIKSRKLICIGDFIDRARERAKNEETFIGEKTI